jgi:hypothetical protein
MVEPQGAAALGQYDSVDSLGTFVMMPPLAHFRASYFPF